MNKKTSIFTGYYGWIIVVLSAITLFFSSPGQTYSISIFINYYIENFGWGRTEVSSYFSIATMVAGFMLPVIGKAIDKKGHRKMIVFLSLSLGIAALWMSFVNNSIMLFIGFLFLRLLGQGSMSLLPNTLVPSWFVNNRGKALSLMSLGGVVGSATVPPINNFLINSFGAPNAWRVWMVLLIGFMAPVGFLFIRNKPEDMLLKPDGLIKGDIDNKILKFSAKVDVSDYPWTLKEAMKTRAFWLMLICMTIPSMINTGITFHIVSIIGEKGFSSTFAATILSMTALVQLPMTFVAGYLVDKIKVHYVKGFNFILYFFVILSVLYGNNAGLLLIYAVLHGTFMAFDSVSTGVLWPNYYGIKNQGSIRGIAMTAMVIGSSLGPLPFGIAYDIFGGYTEILIIMMFFTIIGTIASFISPAPKEPKNIC